MLLFLPVLLSIGDLSLETANIVDSNLVLIPIWVNTVDRIVNTTQRLWVTARQASTDADHAEHTHHATA
jgi:hypothetical protein